MATDFEIGYALSSEEHPPNDMVRLARRAQEDGYGFIGISDTSTPGPTPRATARLCGR